MQRGRESTLLLWVKQNSKFTRKPEALLCFCFGANFLLIAAHALKFYFCETLVGKQQIEMLRIFYVCACAYVRMVCVLVFCAVVIDQVFVVVAVFGVVDCRNWWRL